MQAGSPVLKYKRTLAEAKYRLAYPLFLGYLAAVFRFGTISNSKPLKVSGRHCGERPPTPGHAKLLIEQKGILTPEPNTHPHCRLSFTSAKR